MSGGSLVLIDSEDASSSSSLSLTGMTSTYNVYMVVVSNVVVSADWVYCHNESDVSYYLGLGCKDVRVMRSLMIPEDLIPRNEWGDATILGGNWVKDYGGFDYYQVALKLGNPITAITTGRMKPEESQMLEHIPWVMWREWIDILSQFNVGVQLGTAAAGQFQLNTSFHGIPCIGYSNLNTQRILHPLTTVELGEIDKAKDIARKLKDEEFYNLCMETTQKRFEKYYSEEMFVKNWKRIWSS